MESKMTRSASPERYILVSFSARRAGSEGIRLRVTAGELIARSRKGRGRATQKWRGVKNSKKAARSLRTRTAGRSVSHAGRGETRFPAADGPTVLYTSSAQENFRLARFYRRSSAFIGGQYGVFAFALDREKKHIWPLHFYVACPFSATLPAGGPTPAHAPAVRAHRDVRPAPRLRRSFSASRLPAARA